jgi:hypothetical protein
VSGAASDGLRPTIEKRAPAGLPVIDGNVPPASISSFGAGRGVTTVCPAYSAAASAGVNGSRNSITSSMTVSCVPPRPR